MLRFFVVELEQYLVECDMNTLHLLTYLDIKIILHLFFKSNTFSILKKLLGAISMLCLKIYV